MCGEYVAVSHVMDKSRTNERTILWFAIAVLIVVILLGCGITLVPFYKCHECDGEGIILLQLDSDGEKLSTIQCDRCRGKGAVSPMEHWMYKGRGGSH